MSRPPDLAFVACIAGVLERQALLLFESIRSFGGALSECPIYALAPRAGLEGQRSELTERVHSLEREIAWSLARGARLQAGLATVRRSTPFRLSEPLRRARAWWRARREASRLEKAGLFDAAWYLEQNPDVAAAGLNPFAHYVLHGHGEGRSLGEGGERR